jgi:hypothetical protein
MMQAKSQTANGSPAAIHVAECRGGGFVVTVGSEIYAACAGPHEVASALAALLAERDDGIADAPPAKLPVPARSGTDPLPEGIRPTAPPAVDPMGADMSERLRATAGVALMALVICVRAVVGV